MFGGPGAKQVAFASNATEALNIARGVLSGEIEDNTGGATHYHADYVSPSWADQLEETATIGAHIFYGGERGRQDVAAIYNNVDFVENYALPATSPAIQSVY